MKKTILILFVVMIVTVFAGVVGAEGQDDKVIQIEYKNQKKEPISGAFFSLIIPGGGYYYVGDYDKAKLHGGIELAALLGVVALDDQSFNDFLTLGYIGIKAFNVFDSYISVKKYNEKLMANLRIEPEVSLKDKRAALSLALNF